MSDHGPPELRHRHRLSVRLGALLVLVLLIGCVLGMIVLRARVKASWAAYRDAQLTREVAEIALTEYIEGILKPDIATVDGEISVAEADLKSAERRLGGTNPSAEESNVAWAEPPSQLEIKRAKFRLQQAQNKRMNLEQTKARMIGELKSEIEKAKAIELGKEKIYTQAKASGMGLF
jgi:hypothetical protein